MTDWAYKIASRLEVGIEGQEPEQFIAAMSAALRKAKAQGMREAIDKPVTTEMIEAGVQVLWSSGTVDGQCEADRPVVKEIYLAMVQADKIEKGES